MTVKTAIFTIFLLCGIGFSQTHEDGFVSLTEQGEVKFNYETVANIGSNKSLFAYSVSNGLLTMAVILPEENFTKFHTMMYTIDLKNKTIVKTERLGSEYTYKDSDFEMSLFIDDKDTNTVTMQYITKGQSHKVALPFSSRYISRIEFFILKNNFIVFSVYGGELYSFSMESKKFTCLGSSFFNVSESFDLYNGWYIPLNKYVIYSNTAYNDFRTKGNVYLYSYSEDITYSTRYRNTRKAVIDTIKLNIKNGNTYNQFLPLTQIDNMDSLIRLDKAIQDTLFHKYDILIQIAIHSQDRELLDSLVMHAAEIDIDEMYNRLYIKVIENATPQHPKSLKND